jgi:molecular chaperone HscB
VQQKVHPDMHAQASDSDKRVSMQLSALANSAYRTLMNPIQRGLYMCARNGVDPQLETNTAMPAQFLMQQMEWREALDDVRDQPSKLDDLYKEVEKTRANLLKEVEVTIDEANNFELAATQLRALLFIDKFGAELEDAISA